MSVFTTTTWLTDFNLSIDKVVPRIEGKEVSLEQAFNEVMKLLRKLRERDGALWWIGNGGSAAICSHLSQDVMGKLNIRSMAFSDVALLTCCANDFGYSQSYMKPLEKMVRKGDMLIAISSSGNSKNILNAVDFARKKDMPCVTLSGFSEDNLLRKQSSDVDFYLPSNLYGIVEVGHELLLHCLIETMGRNES